MADVGGQELGRRVGDRQEPAVAAGKDPAAVVERDVDLFALFDDDQLFVLGRQEDVVIELGDDFAERVADGEKIDDEVVGVERARRSRRRRGSCGRGAVRSWPS